MGPLRTAAVALLLVAGCTSSGPDAAEVAAPPTEEVYRTAQEHPGWEDAVDLCSDALVEAAEVADYGSPVRIFRYPESADLLEPTCYLLTDCLWQETGNVFQEFTVRSRQALEDCWNLVFDYFE